MNAKDSVTVPAGIVMNVVTVVGVIIVNKSLSANDGYSFMVFLSFIHFVFTAIGTRVMLYLNLFQYKDVNTADMMPVAVGSLLSVGFMNLNLNENSVGIYQMSKLACIPVTLVLQYMLFKQTVGKAIAITLVPMMIGVGLSTVYDVDANFLGTIYATLAVVATALAQIFTSSKQKSLGCNALQLLYHTAPVIAAGMLVMCPMFDDVDRLMSFVYTPGVIFRIGLSCVLALGVNVSNYLVLGMTSPLTYQVLGHVKTIFILILGFVVFSKPVDGRQAIGILLGLASVIVYTELKRRQTSLPESPSKGRSDKV